MLTANWVILKATYIDLRNARERAEANWTVTPQEFEVMLALEDIARLQLEMVEAVMLDDIACGS